MHKEIRHMERRKVRGDLRYKDRGRIEYTITQGQDNENDALELKYIDPEKTYVWAYCFGEDGKTALEHIEEATYETLKAGFVANINNDGYYLHKGEYQLLKEAIVIFVSHKKYIYDICSLNGMC